MRLTAIAMTFLMAVLLASNSAAQIVRDSKSRQPIRESIATIVNDYASGQGIPPHVDAPLFSDTILSVSLGSSCVMEFTNEAGGREEQFLEPMSALVMGGEARHEWKHAIVSRPVDLWQGREWPRGRRVSLTFRQVLPADQRPNWEPASWAKLRNRLPPTSSSR